jgi:K+-transporting ATPase ATPase C chain
MMSNLRPAIVLMVFFTALLGLGYPLAITGISQATMPEQANGSLIRNGQTIVGSSLIGQNFASDRYFWPRPSVAGDGYDASASSGSSLGPTSAKLKARVADDVERLRAAGVTMITGDSATASGSGLDPHVSPDFATAQIPRIAASRGLPEQTVASLVRNHVESRLLGLIGEPRVNVLVLNLALDAAKQ